MASRTSNQAWSKGLDAGAYCKYLTDELQTASVAYFQRKLQLSGFSAYPNTLPSLLIWIIGVLLYLTFLNSI
jgi:hypothetical protein